MNDGWQSIGAQRVRVDGDIIFSQWFGVCTIQEMDEFLAFADKAIGRISLPFLIIDNTHAAPAPPQVRERLFAWARNNRIAGGVVIFGATAATRIIGLLVTNAIALFRNGESAKRITFVRDEAAARAWIEHRRVELGAKRTG